MNKCWFNFTSSDKHKQILKIILLKEEFADSAKLLELLLCVGAVLGTVIPFVTQTSHVLALRELIL